jgi:hypothetical protein
LPESGVLEICVKAIALRPLYPVRATPAAANEECPSKGRRQMLKTPRVVLPVLAGLILLATSPRLYSISPRAFWLSLAFAIFMVVRFVRTPTPIVVDASVRQYVRRMTFASTVAMLSLVVWVVVRGASGLVLVAAVIPIAVLAFIWVRLAQRGILTR